VGCDADLSAAPEAPFALMIDASARRVQESRLAARDLTLAIATFIWTGLLCASYDRLIPFSFLILIGRFATLGCMVSPSSTPVHHAMCMVSFAWWTGNVRR
jgi:hypothetical protein